MLFEDIFWAFRVGGVVVFAVAAVSVAAFGLARGREGLHPSLGYYALSGLVGSGLVNRAVVYLWVLRSVGATCHKP